MSVGAISSRFPVAVFLTLILLPTFLFGVDGPWIGEDVPFQPRAAFPQRFSQRLFKEFGRWFGDRIGLRYPLIYAAVGYDVLLLRWPIDRYVVFGREGWLFLADSIDGDKNTLADFRGQLRFRPNEITRINAGLEAVRKRLEACGITFLVVLVPNKQSIYGSYLGSDEGGVRSTIFCPISMNRCDPSSWTCVVRFGRLPTRMHLVSSTARPIRTGTRSGPFRRIRRS